MKIKRSIFNEIVLKSFLNGGYENGYKSSHNGEWYFKLRRNTLYGEYTLYLRNDMGADVHQVTEDNIEYLGSQIFKTLCDLPKILERERLITEFLIKPENADLRR